VEEHIKSIVNRYDASGEDQKEKISEFFLFSDEEDCGTITCSLYEEECASPL